MPASFRARAINGVLLPAPLNQHSYTQLAKFIKIWQFDKEFGKFDFTFTQVDDIAAVADLEQQHRNF